MANPHKSHKQENAKAQQEYRRHDGVCPEIESVVVFSSDSKVDTIVSKVNELVDDDHSHSNIADFSCHSAIMLMLGFGLVFPAKHLRNFKVPVSE
jgi:hypothetical protein